MTIPRHALVATFAFACCALVGPSANARDAAGFECVLEQTLSDPKVYLAGTTPLSPLLTKNNRIVDFYSGTAAATRHLCEAIASAEQEILLQVYEWDDCDESGQLVRRALEERIARAEREPTANAPLRIRVVVNDSWPTRRKTPHHLLTQLFERSKRADLSGGRVLVELSERKGFAFSVVHAKYAVVDGRQLILRTNNFLTMDGIERDFYNFSVHAEGPVAETVRADWLALRAESQLRESASHRPATWPDESLAAADPSDSPSEAEGGAPAAILSRNSRANLLADRSSNPQNAGLLALIGAAEHEILSLNPALNVAAIVKALEDAILSRGVDVTLILTLNMNRQVQDLLQGGDNARIVLSMVRRLLEAGGPQAAEHLHVRWASNGTGGPAPAHALGNNHAKTAMYDGQALWVGSMNWDWQSWNNSRELSAVFFDPTAVPRWQQAIWQPIWDKAAPVTAEDFKPCHSPSAGNAAACSFLREQRSPALAALHGPASR